MDIVTREGVRLDHRVVEICGIHQIDQTKVDDEFFRSMDEKFVRLLALFSELYWTNEELQRVGVDELIFTEEQRERMTIEWMRCLFRKRTVYRTWMNKKKRQLAANRKRRAAIVVNARYASKMPDIV